MRVLILCLFLLACSKENNVPNIGNRDVPIVDDKIKPITSESTEIGNGGDLIKCRPRLPLFPFEYSKGWYVLDYVEEFGRRKEFLEFDQVQKYVDHLKINLSKISESYTLSFENFLQQVPFLKLDIESIKFDVDLKREWIETNQNEHINDENPSQIPRNCFYFSRDKRNWLNLHQVVVRNEYVNEVGKVNKILYSFDVDLIERIGDKPLQISMLLFHEWLWDIFPPENSRELRKANRIFHDRSSLQMTGTELSKYLEMRTDVDPKPIARPKKK